MAAAVMVSRQGRELQRYSTQTGGRIVVGCVPYRLRPGSGGVEVLVISSQKKGAAGGVLIPKGGWELDESMEEAALREAAEEAGVAGEVAGPPLGVWWYRSRSYDATYEGIVLPLRVTRRWSGGRRWARGGGSGFLWTRPSRGATTRGCARRCSGSPTRGAARPRRAPPARCSSDPRSRKEGRLSESDAAFFAACVQRARAGGGIVLGQRPGTTE
ncbi:hypothetical protein PR202_gb17316 [Eleusine coracana subsp. coracana]|uniref:Nudix hydrolase domain-containing protein n=1 Tax=Eleusine coracana subsp. coracana TaxID=191504 RepID=A0AAV5F384_ELECO|nr:hypothetical protein PR202_gb17316 [Eleusine coracana subsp. coracana]